MSQEWTPPDNKTIAKIRAMTRSDIVEGEPVEKLVDELVTEDGWPEREAADFVASAVLSASHAARLDALGVKPTVAALVAQGLSVDISEQVVDQYQSLRSARRNQYAWHLLIGGLVGGVGTLVTLGTYLLAEGGGTYIVAGGAMVVGATDFIYGLFRVLFRHGPSQTERARALALVNLSSDSDDS